VRTSKHVQGPLGGTPFLHGLTALNGDTIPPPLTLMVIPRSFRSPRCWSGDTTSFYITHCIPRHILAPWDSGLSTGSQGCGSLRGKAPTQAPPTVGLPWHHHNHWEWGGDTTLLIVPAMGFGKLPLVYGSKWLPRNTCVLEDHPIPCLSYWTACGPYPGVVPHLYGTITP
jgi:hypothetical protein